jgi:hypothetical protein
VQRKTGVQGLLVKLTEAGHAIRWVVEGTSRHGLISKGLYSASFDSSVTDETLQRALGEGWVTLGDPEPLPEYEHGRGQWRYEEGREGRPILLTEAGRKAYLEQFFPARNDESPRHPRGCRG